MTIWTKFVKKGVSGQNRKKWTASLNSAYSNYSRYQISASTDNFDFLEQICPRVFPIKKRKNEHYHWILHVRISAGTKFQLKLIILIFWTKFAQKGYLYSKTKKSEQYHWILHIRIRLDAIFLGAMALLDRSRESWPSMAPLGHVENSQMKMLWHF